MTDENKISRQEAWTLTRRMFLLWWKAAPQTVLSIVISGVLTAVLPYIGIYFTARLLDAIAQGRDPRTLWSLLLMLLLSFFLTGLASAVATRWKNAVCATDYFLQGKLFSEKFLSMDYAVADDPAVMELYVRVMQNTAWTGWGLTHVFQELPALVEGLTRTLGAVALSVGLFLQPVPAGSPLKWLDHPLCVAVLLGLMLLAAVAAPRLSNRSETNMGIEVEKLRTINRMISFYACVGFTDRPRALDIRTYRQDAFFREKIKEFLPRMLTEKSPVARAARFPFGLYKAAGAAVSRAFTGAAYLYVALKALGGAFSVGAVTQYVAAITALGGGLTLLFQVAGAQFINAPYLKLAFQFLDIPNKMYQGSLTTEKRSDNQYEVEFRDVSFQYPGSESYALRHVNMKFQVGRRLAVVGQNGSGKTTFIKLLCRLYDPTEGEILLNGIDIRKYRYDDYMDIFSVVFQDFQLLSLPLGQNVASGQRYDANRVTKALEEAGFGPRLKEMPKGLDTYLYKDLDKDGVEISGGEAQKIAIARALYKKSAFLILDEPTAALDPVAEAEIYAHLNEIVGDRTCIYISHRLSSCRFCDDIAVFDHGGVVQQGSHETLVADEKGKYHELWYAQAQYYTE